MLASTCSIRRWIEARVKFLSRMFTALKRLPSIASSLSCVAESESPSNMGFGAAAVRLFDEMHVKPQTKLGEPVSGRRVRITFNFRLI